jgi:DnaJ-class molecular chaperone
MSTPEDAAGKQDTPEEHGEPQPCMPCHGSGQVISNLGGTPRKTTCPWCRGGGVRIAGADAQEYRREKDR